MMRLVGVVVLLFLPALAARADPMPSGPRVGDTVEIRRESRSSSETNDGGSSSSFDRDTLTERVVAIRENGLELEYDLPNGATPEDRARQWQLPVRVFKPVAGPVELLNGAELEARVDPWLQSARMTRAACGRWIFTWNAFRIDCDPHLVLDTLAAFDMRSGELRDGASYQAVGAAGPAPMKRKKGGSKGATFVVKAAVDPEAVRRERAEADVVVAEINRSSLTLEAALRARSTEAVSGTIIVTLETDSTGAPRRSTTVTVIEIREPGGKLETQTFTVILERRAPSAARETP